MDRLVSNNTDEIRLLQDRIRKLKLENEQLRSQNLKNGFVDNGQVSSLESNANRMHLYDSDDMYSIVNVSNIDFLDEERWLYTLPNYSKTHIIDIMKWVRQDVDNTLEWQLARRKLISRIEEFEQSMCRNIDSRTFTRPKKRVCRPTLGTMVESPLMEDSKLSNMQSSWHMTDSMLIGETLDDISNPFSSGTFSIVDLEATKLSLNTPQHVEVVDHGAGRRKSDTRMPRLEVPAKHSLDGTITVQRMEEGEDPVHRSFPVEQVENPLDKSVGNSSIVHHRDVNNPTHQTGVINHTFQKMASEPRLHMTSETRLDYPLERRVDVNLTFKRPANINVNNTFLKSSDPSLDSTLGKVLDVNATFLLNSRSRSLTPSGLNSTFVVQDKVSESGSSNPSLRTASVDSGADDDQMSSASDSSFSSSNRLLNVGDVQNIARMQEESLRQVMSTPFQGRGREVLGSSLGENPPSPIQPKNPAQEVNHDAHYQSDHSDNSSVDGGQTRSSRSSRSSPGNSPLGSTQVLANNVRENQHHMERKLIPPRTTESHKIEVPAMRGSGAVGLRPPAIRTKAVGPARPVSGLLRPTGPGGSAIFPGCSLAFPPPVG